MAPAKGNKRQITQQILNLIKNVKRQQPAYNVADCQSPLCFDLDFKDITDEEKKKIAGIALHVFDDFVTKKLLPAEKEVMLRLGENVMLGSFLAVRLGRPEASAEIMRQLIEARLGLLKENANFNPKEFLHGQFLDYLEFCEQHGREIALKREVV
jgi:hypothetical protein